MIQYRNLLNIGRYMLRLGIVRRTHLAWMNNMNETGQFKCINNTLFGSENATFISLITLNRQTGYFALHGYQALLHKPERQLNFPVSGSFHDITAVQAYNLLKGRAVRKAPGKPDALIRPFWFREYEGSLITVSDFRLADSLSRLPFPKGQTGRLLKQLENGNLVLMQLPADNRIYMAANPEAKGLTIYNSKMAPLMHT